ncbi:uncharacterized protein LOC126815624 [Patella vulgata]|uniref:uncharacterized protein LOC126815624 n=1 Tax=Patella vulgata TaxID=6465 RepID=UPI0024A9A1FE|nr:uncharacterized protein LOC126815624 [Patella vulgata]
MAIPETTVGADKAPVVCADKSPSCAALGLDICTNPLYHAYVVASCAGHCKLCEGGITVATTVNPKTTSLVPTTKIITAHATAAAACVDTIPNCEFYSINDCGSYPQWAKSNCQRYCNLCPSCVDKLTNCDNFDASVCVTPNYAQWAKENCARKCNMCDKGCYYNGTLFEEGAQIQDGCKFVCICHDGNTGRYGCTSLCFEYTLPSECTLLPPKPGKCCKTPSCPANIHLNTTGGNLIG